MFPIASKKSRTREKEEGGKERKLNGSFSHEPPDLHLRHSKWSQPVSLAITRDFIRNADPQPRWTGWVRVHSVIDPQVIPKNIVWRRWVTSLATLKSHHLLGAYYYSHFTDQKTDLQTISFHFPVYPKYNESPNKRSRVLISVSVRKWRFPEIFVC